MNILYQILIAAGVIFAFSMLFICLGLLKKPKQKKEPEFDEADYYAGSGARSGRSLDAAGGAADDEYENDEYVEDDYDDDNVEDDNADDETEPDESAESADGDEDDELAADDDGADEKPESGADRGGIKVSVTVIETNKTHELTVTKEALIGRNPGCDVVVPKPMVSSVHCILTKDKDKLMVEDNNSTNGTFLNGKPLKHVVEVKNNDMLTLGDRQIRINL